MEIIELEPTLIYWQLTAISRRRSGTVYTCKSEVRDEALSWVACRRQPCCFHTFRSAAMSLLRCVPLFQAPPRFLICRFVLCIVFWSTMTARLHKFHNICSKSFLVGIWSYCQNEPWFSGCSLTQRSALLASRRTIRSSALGI